MKKIKDVLLIFGLPLVFVLILAFLGFLTDLNFADMKLNRIKDKICAAIKATETIAVELWYLE